MNAQQERSLLVSCIGASGGIIFGVAFGLAITHHIGIAVMLFLALAVLIVAPAMLAARDE